MDEQQKMAVAAAASSSALAPRQEEGGDDEQQGRIPSLRPRPSALFYPSSNLAAHSNQKPFSKSAAKRESVLALGSIGHLQHLFSKQGIASKQRPQMAGNLTLAIGHAGQSALLLHESPPSSPTATGGRAEALAALDRASSPTPQSQQPILVLPPSPVPPQNKRLPYPNIERPTDVDPEALLPEVVQALDETCQKWDLIGLLKSSYRSAPSDAGHTSNRSSTIGETALSSSVIMERTLSDGTGPASVANAIVGSPELASHRIDVLELIQSTTRTIRRVRAYLLAFPADILATRLAERAGLHLTQSDTAALAPRSQKNAFRRMSSYSQLPQLPRSESRTGHGPTSGSSFGPSATPSGMSAHVASASSTTSPVKKRSAREASETDARSSNGHESAHGSIDTASGVTSPPRLGASGASNTSSPAKKKVLDDPLVVIRKSALDVLGMLRELEERYRLPPDHPAYSARQEEDGGRRSSAGLGLDPAVKLSAQASNSNRASTSGVANSLASMRLREDDVSEKPRANSGDNGVDFVSETTGFLYQQNVLSAELKQERSIVRDYVDTVDYVLSAVLSERKSSSSGLRPSRSRATLVEHGDSSSRASSAQGFTSSAPFASEALKEEEEGVAARHATSVGSDSLMEDLDSDDERDTSEELKWNRPGVMPGGIKTRMTLLMDELLPADLRQHLQTRRLDTSEALLQVLADGHLLCLAYNAALRRSRRPWGFIREDDIHALVGNTSAPEAAKWTFRKIDNLRNWGAALRLRYGLAADEMVPVDLDRDWNEQLAASSVAPNDEAKKSIRFEPRLVARREDGWQLSLAALVGRWLKAVGDEEMLKI
ncbi:hypothetical protein OC861_002423 [Tilletia horrida]|nr:hypothetical protein OC861_002423 [Tilletia horrida]